MNKEDKEISKVILITGGYGHLGSGLVEGLVSNEVHVVVGGRSKSKFDMRFKDVDHRNVYFIELDITNTDSVKNCFLSVFQKFGRIDALINNAARTRGRDPETLSDDDWDFSMQGTLGSVFKGIREIIPYMKEQKSGKIINISSMYGVVSPDFNLYSGELSEFRNPPQYGAAKAAVIQLTKYYASYLAPLNIQVNAISPGPFPNLNIQQQFPEFISALKAKTPCNKIGRPKDLIGVTKLLCSSESDFITGQNFIIDGGWTII